MNESLWVAICFIVAILAFITGLYGQYLKAPQVVTIEGNCTAPVCVQGSPSLNDCAPLIENYARQIKATQKAVNGALE